MYDGALDGYPDKFELLFYSVFGGNYRDGKLFRVCKNRRQKICAE